MPLPANAIGYAMVPRSATPSLRPRRGVRAVGEAPLAGHAILIVEDEYLIASDLRRELVRAGAAIVGPVPSLAKAVGAIAAAGSISGAILDVSLQGEMVFPVADLLRTQGVPFVLATGYDRSMIPARFDDVVWCEKPVEAGTLCDVVATMVAAPRGAG